MHTGIYTESGFLQEALVRPLTKTLTNSKTMSSSDLGTSGPKREMHLMWDSTVFPLNWELNLLSVLFVTLSKLIKTNKQINKHKQTTTKPRTQLKMTFTCSTRYSSPIRVRRKMVDVSCYSPRGVWEVLWDHHHHVSLEKRPGNSMWMESSTLSDSSGKETLMRF